MPFSVDSQHSYAKQYYAAWRSDTEERHRTRSTRHARPAVDSPIAHVVADGVRRQNRCRIQRACSPTAGGTRWTSATHRAWSRRSRTVAGGCDGAAANCVARSDYGVRAVECTDARCGSAARRDSTRRADTISPAPCRIGTCSGESRTSRCDVAATSRTRNVYRRFVGHSRSGRSCGCKISRQSGATGFCRSRGPTAVPVSPTASPSGYGRIGGRALSCHCAVIHSVDVFAAHRLRFKSQHDRRSSLRSTNARLLSFVRHLATHTPQMP